jgi:integrase
MGSIRRPRDGRGWEARYRAPEGRQRSKVFGTKREADRFLARVDADQQRGEWVDPRLGRVRFDEYTANWMHSTTHWRPGTVANVESRLRRHILPAFGSHPLGRIQPVDVRAWIAEMTRTGLSASSVVAAYRVFARIMRTAEIDGYIVRTPCLGISLPRETSHHEMHYLDHEQVALLAGSIDARYRALIYTAAYTGMRWGELAALQVRNVNLLRGNIDIVEASTEVNGHLHVGPTKTGARRAVSLPRFLGEMLSAHLERYPPVDGFLFTSAEGCPLRRNFYRRDFKPCVRAAGLPEDLRFHDLRHTCAALLIAQGAHPKEIQERLGHSTIRLTFDRYGHLFPSLDDRLRDGLEAGFRIARTSRSVAAQAP